MGGCSTLVTLDILGVVICFFRLRNLWWSLQKICCSILDWLHKNPAQQWQTLFSLASRLLMIAKRNALLLLLLKKVRFDLYLRLSFLQWCWRPRVVEQGNKFTEITGHYRSTQHHFWGDLCLELLKFAVAILKKRNCVKAQCQKVSTLCRGVVLLEVISHVFLQPSLSWTCLSETGREYVIYTMYCICERLPIFWVVLLILTWRTKWMFF